MAFASSLLPAPASRVRASPASELVFPPVNRKGGVSLRRRGARLGVRAEVNESGSALAVDALSQAAATTTSLAKKYGANITVVDYLTENKGKGLNFVKMDAQVREASFKRILEKNPDLV